MSAELLAELKKLQYQRSDTSPFASQIELQRWVDEVSPRLSFDPKLQSSFKSRIKTASLQFSSGYSNIEQINEAIGIFNQAVLSLELPPFTSPQLPEPISPTRLEPPQKVTVKWLYEHVPSSLVFGGIALLASTFLAGIAFSQTQLYAFIRDAIATPHSAATNASANKKTIPANTASNISAGAK